MMKIVKNLLYKARCDKLYRLLSLGRISWNEYTERRKKLNERYIQ